MPRSGNPMKRHARQISGRKYELIWNGTTLIVDARGDEGTRGVRLLPLREHPLRLMTSEEQQQTRGDCKLFSTSDGEERLAASALKSAPDKLLYEALESITAHDEPFNCRPEGLPWGPNELDKYAFRLHKH